MATEKQLVTGSSTGAVVLVKDSLPKQKTRPKVALEEDEFTEAIGKIIRRDFFPDLPKLEAQLAFIEATESNDPDKLREISARYPTHLKTPNATPATFQTPLSSATPSQNRKRPSGVEEDEGATKVPRPEDAKSLDAFLNTYQSEDDASFDGIMKLEEEKRLEKYSWMYERESLAKEMNSIAPALTSGDGPKPIQGGGAKAITDGGEGEKDGRGQIKMWDYTAKNTLMYIPDGAGETTKELIKKRNDKIIRHGNTRLTSDFLRKMSSVGGGGGGQVSLPESAKEKVGIDGKAVHASDSPQVNGYGFVATPQIRPGVDASPMMTWGTVEGTPLHISGDITPTPGPTFKIPKTPRRDELAHQLAEKASKSLREKKRVALERTSHFLKSPYLRSPSGSTTAERLKFLSPAARKLVSSSPGTGIFKGSDKSLRASYTPTRPSSVSSRKSDSGISKPVPKSHRNELSSPSQAPPPSLTDNLLNLSND